jgi:hypothetical protein
MTPLTPACPSPTRPRVASVALLLMSQPPYYLDLAGDVVFVL